jgi:hypothetical protein
VRGAGAAHPACTGGQAGLRPINYLILFSFSFFASFLKTFKILIFQKKSKHLKKSEILKYELSESQQN